MHQPILVGSSRTPGRANSTYLSLSQGFSSRLCLSSNFKTHAAERALVAVTHNEVDQRRSPPMLSASCLLRIFEQNKQYHPPSYSKGTFRGHLTLCSLVSREYLLILCIFWNKWQRQIFAPNGNKKHAPLHWEQMTAKV